MFLREPSNPVHHAPWLITAVVCVASVLFYLRTHDKEATTPAPLPPTPAVRDLAHVPDSQPLQVAQVQPPTPQPTERVQAVPTVPAPQPTAAPVPEERPRAANGCTATTKNFGWAPGTVTVEAGQLVVADFGTSSQAVTILPPGSWTTKPGYNVGQTWIYPDCPREVVEIQAKKHVTDSGSTGLLESTTGFTQG